MEAEKNRIIRIVRLPESNVSIPQRKTRGSSGFDLHADCTHPIPINPGKSATIGTGLAFEIPHGFEGQVRGRSGLASKHGVFVLNSPGTVDSDYRGEVCVILYNAGRSSFTVNHGDRIAQIVFCPVLHDATLVEVKELSDTGRGANGFGSTGVK